MNSINYDDQSGSDSDNETGILSPENIFAITAAIGQYVYSLHTRTPMRTSGRQGDAYTREVMEGDPQRGAEVFRMPTTCFRILCYWFETEGLLQPGTRHGIPISIEQQLAMFMAIVGHGRSNRNVQQRFQHSGETIHRYFHQVLGACLELYDRTIKLPPLATPSTILENPKFHPYFDNCIGALDGFHIPVHTHNTQDAVGFRNREGYLSQNVLATCTFDCQFSYILPGCEGSAHDYRVLAHARSLPAGGLSIPDGFYYLADTGYSLGNGILTPYRGVKYHLPEQDAADMHPRTKEELFNLRHAELRNLGERTLEIFKRRFAIFRTAPEYPLRVQVQLVRACAALHNFIRTHSPHEEFTEWDQEEVDNSSTNMMEDQQDTIEVDSEEEDENMKTLRDNIATSMWEDYQTNSHPIG